MREETGESYISSKYAKALLAAEAKVGKSCYLIAQALGVFPGQQHGGVVDSPAHLHVITFDAGALAGVKKFMLETCAAPKEALAFRVYNMQEDALRIATSDKPWDYSLYNTFLQVVREISRRAGQEPGVHAVVISSVTGLAQAIQRGVSGPPGLGMDKKGSAMDMAKWTGYGDQLAEIRNVVHALEAHVLWEAHIDKKVQKGQQGETETEGLALRGQTGQNFAYNVEQVFRVRRQFGIKVENSNADSVFLDTKPQMEFIAGGRNFTEALRPQEPDMMVAFHRLGLTVGRWGAKAKKAKAG